MTRSGELRSPLEASVQELCNARLVEAICTWTNAAIQFPQTNPICSLFPARCRPSLLSPVFQSLPVRTVFSGCMRRGGIAQSFYSLEDQNALPTSTALLSSLDVEWNLSTSDRKPL